MSNVRFTSTYYNTTGPEVEWRIDICDTEAVGSVINFESVKPLFNFEGLTEELTAGIFPSSFKFGMYIRSAPKNIGGTVFGPSESFISDLLGSNEGRFRVKVYKDSEIYFIGVIMPDECNYEDDDSPYLMNVTAVDGLYRLKSEEYVSQVGQIEYISLSKRGTGSTEFSDVPVTDGLVGTEWVLIEHYSHAQPGISGRISTYARYEQYSLTQPDTGWVDQGGGLWAKEVDYFNEVIIDEATKYHLTRDIDNIKPRTFAEYYRRAMEMVATWDEYADGVGMYDVCDGWYDAIMRSQTDDPTTMIRMHEDTIAVGKKWWDILEIILKHRYCRLYYAEGRYHIEQISQRGSSSVKRYVYDKDGDLVTTDTVNLDLSYSGLGLSVNEGGKYKVMAPLRSVKITQKTKSSNFLEGEVWSLQKIGSRYISRIRTTQDDTRFLVHIPIGGTKAVDFPPSFPTELFDVTGRVVYRIQIRNVDTEVTYYLTPPSQDDFADPTWELDEVNGYFEKEFTVQAPYAPILNSYVLHVLSDELPGSAGQSFDLTVSITLTYNFINPVAQQIVDNNPQILVLTISTYNPSITTVDVDLQPVDSVAEKVVEAINSTDNTVMVEMDAIFSDFGSEKTAIQVHALLPVFGNQWTKSSRAWGRVGGPIGVQMLQLLAHEMLALRTVPLRIYSGGFVTQMITTQNRIDRNSIIYLPLSLTVDTDYDLASGDFVHLERIEADEPDVTDIPFEGEDLIGGGLVDVIGPPVDPPLYFETNEVIVASSTLTEIDIINTLGQHIAAGEVVRITDPDTGDYESVVLTQDIEPLDTVMYFTSHTFTLGFPDGSLITVLIEEYGPSFPGMPYRYTNLDYSLDYHNFPAYYQFPNPEQNSAIIINSKIKVWRNGILLTYKAGATTQDQWDINYEDRQITFPFAFDGERIDIDAR